jgi:transcriptional regulator with XRE-family HTH domain
MYTATARGKPMKKADQQIKANERDAGTTDDHWDPLGHLPVFRQRHGLSQNQLAKESGVSVSVIANYESSRTSNLSFENLLKIYRAIEIRERATQGAKPHALKYVLSLLLLKKQQIEHDKWTLHAQSVNIQRQYEATDRELTAVTTEEKQLRQARPGVSLVEIKWDPTNDS